MPRMTMLSSSSSKYGANSKPSNVAPWRRSRCVPWKQCGETVVQIKTTHEQIKQCGEVH